MRSFFPLLVAAALALPASAGAATVSVLRSSEPGSGSADSVNFTASPGEANIVTTSADQSAFPQIKATVRDAGAPLAAGPGCRAVSPNEVACDVSEGLLGAFQLGDGDDRYTGSDSFGPRVDGSG